MSQNINPSPGFVLIRDKQTDKIGNFTMVEEEKKEAMIGEVIKAGEPKISDKVVDIVISTSCKEGDTIIYPKYHSNSFDWQGEEYKIIAFEDILGVINE